MDSELANIVSEISIEFAHVDDKIPEKVTTTLESALIFSQKAVMGLNVPFLMQLGLHAGVSSRLLMEVNSVQLSTITPNNSSVNSGSSINLEVVVADVSPVPKYYEIPDINNLYDSDFIEKFNSPEYDHKSFHEDVVKAVRIAVDDLVKNCANQKYIEAREKANLSKAMVNVFPNRDPEVKLFISKSFVMRPIFTCHLSPLL